MNKNAMVAGTLVYYSYYICSVQYAVYSMHISACR